MRLCILVPTIRAILAGMREWRCVPRISPVDRENEKGRSQSLVRDGSLPFPNYFFTPSGGSLFCGYTRCWSLDSLVPERRDFNQLV